MLFDELQRDCFVRTGGLTARRRLDSLPHKAFYRSGRPNVKTA